MERKTPGGGIRKLEDAVSAAEGYNTGLLNPAWVAWLMGFPLDWLDVDGYRNPQLEGLPLEYLTEAPSSRHSETP